MVNVTTHETRAVAREVEDQLEARDIQGLAYVAVAGATGVLLANEVTQRVLPLIFDSSVTQATTPVQFAASAGIKIGLGLVLGAVGAAMSGAVQVFVVLAAVGSVIFGGTDIVNAVDMQFNLFGGTGGSATQSSHTQPAGGSGNRRAPSPSQGSQQQGYAY